MYCYSATLALHTSAAISIHELLPPRHTISPALNTREKHSTLDCFDHLFQTQLHPKTPNAGFTVCKILA